MTSPQDTPRPPLRIAIILKDFLWSGGVHFIRNAAEALACKSKDCPIEVILIAPEKSFKEKARHLTIRFLIICKRIIRAIISLSRPNFEIPSYSVNIKEALKEFENINHLKIQYANNPQEIDADIFFPILPDKYESKRNDKPWMGYIFDFQHKYLPHFFSEKEREGRDESFQKLTDTAGSVIVNCRSVADDILKFIPKTKSKIFALPFSPIPKMEWLEYGRKDIEDIRKKYNLPEKYFVVANQFWIHKSHITAFEALSLLRKKGLAKDIHIVCTGKEYDSRFPDYFENLKKETEKLGVSGNIHFLGYVPKNDQIKIMMGSLAIIQPTLFEGGPGGGSVFDGISMRIPCIVSDIAPNKEMNEKNLFFFTAGSSADLAEIVRKFLETKNKLKLPSKEELIANREKKLDGLGNVLLEAISYATDKKITPYFSKIKKFSIVTPSFNQGKYIEQTIKSVLSQKGDFEIEHIIADGGSTDNTVETIKKYEQALATGSLPINCRGIKFIWWSKKDSGQTGAINEGFEKSTGDILAWINSDDWYEDGAFAEISEIFSKNKNIDLVYGDCNFINEIQKTKINCTSAQGNFNDLVTFNPKDWHIYQPAVFFTRRITEKIGLLDERFQFAFDYDLWIRIFREAETSYLPKTLANFRIWQNSKTSSSQKNFKTEKRLIRKKHGMVIFDRKTIRKISNFFPFDLVRNRFPSFYKSLKTAAFKILNVIKFKSGRTSN